MRGACERSGALLRDGGREVEEAMRLQTIRDGDKVGQMESKRRRGIGTRVVSARIDGERRELERSRTEWDES